MNVNKFNDYLEDKNFSMDMLSWTFYRENEYIEKKTSNNTAYNCGPRISYVSVKFLIKFVSKMSLTWRNHQTNKKQFMNTSIHTNSLPDISVLSYVYVEIKFWTSWMICNLFRIIFIFFIQSCFWNFRTYCFAMLNIFWTCNAVIFCSMRFQFYYWILWFRLYFL